jgi:hypothetical protein
MRSRAVALLLTLLTWALAAPDARAQMGTPSMGGGGQRNNAPTQSGPVQNRSVGPRQGAMQSDDEDNAPQVSQRPTDTMTQAPADPLAISPEVRERIGSDADVVPPAPEGSLHRTYFPYYEERKGDYRFRLLPPLYLEYTRGLPTRTPQYGEPTHEDTQSLTALVYYHRRSPYEDVDTRATRTSTCWARSSTARRRASTTTGSRRWCSRASARTAATSTCRSC